MRGIASKSKRNEGKDSDKVFSRLALFLFRLISLFFMLITGWLFILSLSHHVDTDILIYSMPRSVVGHTPWLYGFLVLCFGFLVFCLFGISEKFTGGHRRSDSLKVAHIVITIGMILILAAGLFWIHFNDSLPRYDQQVVYQEARIIAGFSDGDYNAGYYSTFPRQKGITLLIALVLRLFGDSQLSFRLFNVIGAVLLYLAVCLTAKRLTDRDEYVLVVAVVMIFFYPILAFTAFMYGTELSLCFSSWGFYNAVSFQRGNRIRNAIGMALSFAAGVAMHQVAFVALLGAVVYLIVTMHKRAIFITLITCVLTFAAAFGLLAGINVLYSHITGITYGDSCPPSAVILMGVTSETEDGGPGSIDGSYSRLFQANGNNAEQTNQAAEQKIQQVIREYADGSRKLDFFVRKTEYQWLEPTMGARKIIMLNDRNQGEPQNSEAFTAFFMSNFRNYVDKLSVVFMIYVYLFAAVAGIYCFIHPTENAGCILIEIFMIGGFLFQLMWETLSRYCLPYFTWLIPMALLGEYKVIESVRRIRKPKVQH